MRFYAHKDYGGTGQPNEIRIEFTDVMGEKIIVQRLFSYDEWNQDELKAYLINHLFLNLESKLFKMMPPLLANKCIENLND